MILKVSKNSKETKDLFSLVFEKPIGFNFYPGQYLDIKLLVNDPNGDTKSPDARAFTISSSPSEEFLMVTPKKGVSFFKKFIEQLKSGDTLESSHPAGTFTLDESSPAVFIAGGIGITPFRSMIKYAVDQKLKTPITLIYSNSDDDFPFKQELGNWKQDLENLTIIYHNSSQNGRLINLPTTNYPLRSEASHLPIYYLAGSHSFVNDIAQMLIDSGVDETNIRYDRFDGY